MKNGYLKFKYVSILIICVLILSIFPMAIVRADSVLSISIDGSTEVGQIITVNVIVSQGSYSGFDGSLTYGSNFEYQTDSMKQGPYTATAPLQGDPSYFLVGDGTISGGVLFSAKFKCLSAGTGTITCNLNTLADIDVNPVTVSGASKTITITTPIPKSANADLSSLAIAPGTLSPAFAAGTKNYTASVAANQSKITVSAAPADAKSKVSLNGVQDKLVAGSNTVKVTVTAENGGTKVYTITVTRSAGPTPTPAPTPIPLPLMQYNGTDYTILAAGTADAIPEGFTAATAKYKGVDIPVLQKTLGEAVDASVMTIILLTADARTGYFVYDAAAETCYPYQLISSTAMSFQIMDKTAATSIPAGYEAFDYTYLDNTVTAFRLISDPANPQVLLYLMDGSGITAFYYYDTQNSMLLLYRGEVLIAVATPTPTPTPTTVPSETGAAIPTVEAGLLSAPAAAGITFHSLLDYRNPVVLLIYLVVLFCLILLIVCIVLIAKRGKPYDIEEYEEDTGEYQEWDDLTADAPVTAPKPSVFFQELAQPQEENKLYFGDKTPGQPAEHVPVRLQKELDAEQARSGSAFRATDSSVSGKPANDPDFDPDDE